MYVLSPQSTNTNLFINFAADDEMQYNKRSGYYLTNGPLSQGHNTSSKMSHTKIQNKISNCYKPTKSDKKRTKFVESCHQFHPRPCSQCLHQNQVLATSKTRSLVFTKQVPPVFQNKVPTALAEVQ